MVGKILLMGLFNVVNVDTCRKLGSTKAASSNEVKCAIDHILEAEDKGEINEDNVLYIVENINVAGMFIIHFICQLLSSS